MDKKDQLVLFFFLVLLDQSSKFLFFNLAQHQFNKGISFGWGSESLALNLVNGGIFLLLLGLFFGLKKFKFWHWSLVIFFAGGVSNFLDRLIFAGVRDFLPFFYLNNNLADYFIIVGLVIFILIKYRAVYCEG